MQKRKLGQSGLEVSQLCLGCNVFGWTADENTSFQILDAFVAAGGNFIDTADVYSKWVPGHHGGESESVIGKWLKRSGAREKVVIATKVEWNSRPIAKASRKGTSCGKQKSRSGVLEPIALIFIRRTKMTNILR